MGRAVWPSQRRYLSYFELLQRGLMPTPSSGAAPTGAILLKRVVLVEVGGDSISRYLELWQQESCIFQAEIECLEETTAAVVSVDRKCVGDVSVRVLRVAQAGAQDDDSAQPFEERSVQQPSREVEFQVCFHTAFVTTGEFIRFLRGDIDASSGTRQEGSSIDLFFERKDDKEGDATPDADSPDAAASAPNTDASAAGSSMFFNLADDDSDDETFEEPPTAFETGTTAKSMSGGTQIFSPKDVDKFFSATRCAD